MATTATSTIQEREARLAKLLADYNAIKLQEAQQIDRLNSMNAVLDADTEKYSTTWLTWRGESMFRSDLQKYANETANTLPSITLGKNEALSIYNDYKAVFEDTNTAELYANNPTLAVDMEKAKNDAILAKQKQDAETEANAKKSQASQANVKLFLIIFGSLAVITAGFIVYKKFINPKS